MPRGSYYDVIVVGSDVAGLMTAGLLAKRGYRVLQIGQGDPGPVYSIQGMLLPALPSVLPPFGHAPLLDRVLHELGVEDPVHLLGCDDPALQVVTPLQRIDLVPDRLGLEAELERAFPSEKKTILGLIDGLRSLDDRFRSEILERPLLPPDSWREETKTSRAAEKLANETLPPPSAWPTMLRILAAAAGFHSWLHQDPDPTFINGHFVLALLGGPRTVWNFEELITNAIDKIGCTVEKKTVTQQILVEGKQARGVKTLRGDKTYTCGALVAGLPIGRCLDLFPLDARHKRMMRAANSVRQQGSIFVVNLVLPTDCLPAGMGNQVLIARNPDEQLREGNLILVHNNEFSGAPGKSMLSLACRVAYNKRTLGRELLGPLHKEMIDTARWFVPFLDQCLQSQSSPFWEGRADDEPHPDPWSLMPIFECKREISLGCAVLPCRTPYKNILFCGPETIPGLGVEGAAKTALQTVDLLEEKLKLKKIL